MTQRAVIVTGGLQGIGRAIVDAFARDGERVHVIDVCAQDDPRVTALPAECVYSSCDVSDRMVVHETIKAIHEKSGRIDVLVNNAGITRDGLCIRMGAQAWQQVLDVNLSGAFWCTQAVLPYMMRAEGGAIINLSSVVAATGNPGQVNYAASKAGVEAMTKTLAREYGKRGIRVNAVAPGFIATPLTHALPEAVQQSAIARTALQRAGTPEDVAQAVLFLASFAASYITGQIVSINGGMW